MKCVPCSDCAVPGCWIKEHGFAHTHFSQKKPCAAAMDGGPCQARELPRAILVSPKPRKWVLGDDDPEWQTFLRFAKRTWNLIRSRS
jgi:hypothetical protein